AARLLATRKPAGTAEALLGFLPFADSDNAVDEGRNTLAFLAKKDKDARLVLRAGLTDALPFRRAAAGEALCRAGLAGDKAEVHKLLADDDAVVRDRVAMALVNSGDKEAVPVLIDTLPKLPMAHARLAEDMLYRLAVGQSPPSVPLGTDETARAKCR